MKFFNWVTSAIAAVGAYLLALLGGWDTALEIMVALILLDYATGLVSALANRNINSSIGLRGIAKKVGFLLAVMAAHQFDLLAGAYPALSPNGAPVIRTFVVLALSINEGASILENLAEVGIRIPFLSQFVERARAAFDAQGGTR